MNRSGHRRWIATRPEAGAVRLLLLSSILTGCDRDPQIGVRGGSPLDALPTWISPLLDSGLRPDWSADSRRLIYLDALVGNVYEFDLASRTSRSLTEHFEHNGFTRARYLSSGDLLLCRPGAASSSSEDEGR